MIYTVQSIVYRDNCLHLYTYISENNIIQKYSQRTNKLYVNKRVNLRVNKHDPWTCTNPTSLTSEKTVTCFVKSKWHNKKIT